MQADGSGLGKFDGKEGALRGAPSGELEGERAARDGRLSWRFVRLDCVEPIHPAGDV